MFVCAREHLGEVMEDVAQHVNRINKHNIIHCPFLILVIHHPLHYHLQVQLPVPVQDLGNARRLYNQYATRTVAFSLT